MEINSVMAAAPVSYASAGIDANLFSTLVVDEFMVGQPGSYSYSGADVTFPGVTIEIDEILREPAEDNNFSSRGWYDNTTQTLAADGAIAGSAQSIDWTWAASATKPPNGGAMRYAFPESDNIYVSYRVKYLSGWVGSGQAFHPHEFYFMTNKNGAFDGLFGSELTLYVEQHDLVPRLDYSNPANIDGTQLYDGSTTMLVDTWYKVEAFLKLNTMVGNVGQSDGVFKYWLNGSLEVDANDVLMRTGSANTDMLLDQFILAPWLGEGSPAQQTMLVDEIIIGTKVAIPVTAPVAPSLLVATTASSTTINLAWQDNSDNETNFIVQRSLSAGTGFVTIATLGIGVEGYSSGGLSAETQYFYQVQATNTGGDSTFSNEASDTTSVSTGNAFFKTDFDYPSVCRQDGTGSPVDCSVVSTDPWINWAWDGVKLVGGESTEVVTAAANPNGNGSKGLRVWNGDGTNQFTNAFQLAFPTQQKEIWMRWYQRYEAGFSWSGGNPDYDKIWYIYCNTNNGISGSQMQLLPQFSGNDGLYALSIQGNAEPYQAISTLRWQNVFGSVSDGLFHQFEFYALMDTDGTDGIGRAWIDGQPVINQTGVNFSGGSSQARNGFKWMEGPSNQATPTNGGPASIDYDNIEIWNTTPPNTDANGNAKIGSLNGFDGGA